MSLSGSSRYLSNPVPTQLLNFDLNLNDHEHGSHGQETGLGENDARLRQMLAAQAVHQQLGSADDTETIIENQDLSEIERKRLLQKSLQMAASNGDSERVHNLVSGLAQRIVDVDEPDDDGTVPLTYASCFVSLCARLGPESG